ncbi:MAG TPA: hypothetical protein DDW23_05515 [Planctomycetes bacterium]|nr:hypothetical protein [Planctomycetota bacterium]
MPIYQHRRELNEIEVDALLSCWPTTDEDGATVATHGDLAAAADYDLRPDEVKAAIAASPKLTAAGISAVKDAIAPRWCVVTLPPDKQTDGVWETTMESLALSFVQSHTARCLERPTNDETGDEETGEVTVTGKSGNWRLRDRYDHWLGATGYLAQIEAKL